MVGSKFVAQLKDVTKLAGEVEMQVNGLKNCEDRKSFEEQGVSTQNSTLSKDIMPDKLMDANTMAFRDRAV